MSTTTKQATRKQRLVSVTHFPDGDPQRVIFDANRVVCAVAYGTGRNAGMDIYFDGMNEPVDIGVWDTHMHYVLEQVAGIPILMFDRRHVQADLDQYLEDRFNIKPQSDTKSSRSRGSRAKTRTQQRRERQEAESSHGRGRPCSMCQDEYDPDALNKVRDIDGSILHLCDECEADYIETQVTLDVDHDEDADALATAAATVDDDYADDSDD